jgi:hypothetical protein
MYYSCDDIVKQNTVTNELFHRLEWEKNDEHLIAFDVYSSKNNRWNILLKIAVWLYEKQDKKCSWLCTL